MAFLQTVLDYVSGRRQDTATDLSESKRAAEDAWGLGEADRTPLPTESSAIMTGPSGPRSYNVCSMVFPPTEPRMGTDDGGSAGLSDSASRRLKAQESTNSRS